MIVIILVTIFYSSILISIFSEENSGILTIIIFTITTIGYIWSILLISDYTYMKLSCAFATWYLTEDKNTMLTNEINENMDSAIKYLYNL